MAKRRAETLGPESFKEMLKMASQIVAWGENAPDGAMMRRHPTRLELMPPGRGVFCAVRRVWTYVDDAIVEPLVFLLIASPEEPTLMEMWEQAGLKCIPAKVTELEEDAGFYWKPEEVADPTMDEGSMKLGAILLHYEFVLSLGCNRLEVLADSVFDARFDVKAFEEAERQEMLAKLKFNKEFVCYLHPDKWTGRFHEDPRLERVLRMLYNRHSTAWEQARAELERLGMKPTLQPKTGTTQRKRLGMQPMMQPMRPPRLRDVPRMQQRWPLRRLRRDVLKTQGLKVSRKCWRWPRRL